MKEYIHNLGSLFDEVSSTEPERVAITFSSEENYTFGQLNIDSNRMANLLLHKGLNKNDVCAIAGVKKYYTYVSFVACLKIGVTYTFFDPESPWERLSRIFQKAQPKLVIGYLSEMLERVDQSYDQFNFEGIQNQKEFMLGFNLNFEFDQIEGSTPAYIMFTSGSTGFPKGAAMSHANILNFISWGRQTYSITKNDIHTNVNPLYFDNSVFDLYCSLFNGAQLVPITKSDALNPKRLLDSLYDNKCTTWFSVPSLLIYLISSKAIIPEKWKFVNKIIFGGEGFPKATLNKLYKPLHSNTKLFNVYGPTECSCICSSYEVNDFDFEQLEGFLPLGKMAPNFIWQIVDQNDNPSIDKGELLLGGPNVGLGYYNDPELTKERYIQNPSHQRYFDTFYRTGDLVSFSSSDNKIYIHGRVDNQIKHMGYRIELEEIENAMVMHPSIDDAVVFAIEDKNNNKLIGIYESSTDLDSSEIKLELKKFLPNYMIPAEFSRIDRLQKNANGKTDRKTIKEKYIERWQK